MSLPDLPSGSHHSAARPAWSAFRLDPRQAPQMRLSDRDRDTVREVLASAFADGQLSHDEYFTRLERSSEVATFGDLSPLVHDLTLTPASSARGVEARPTHEPTPEPGQGVRGLDVAIKSVGYTAAGVVGINVVVWLLVSVTNGELIYFWPVWPALGMAIPIMVLLMIRHATDTEQDQINREAHRRRQLDRRRRRRERRRGHRELGR